MSIKSLRLITALSVSLMGSAYAVNGAFDFGFSEITRGMAGAGSALPQDSIIPAINPAGLTRVKKQFDVGAAFYFPDIRYTASAAALSPGAIVVAPGTVKSSTSLYFLPDLGINLPIDDKSSFGVAMYSLGGFGNRYTTSAVGGVQTLVEWALWAMAHCALT